MTNFIAFWLGALILVVLAVDVLFFGTDHILFLAKKMLELMDWIAFWR